MTEVTTSELRPPAEVRYAAELDVPGARRSGVGCAGAAGLAAERPGRPGVRGG